MRVIPSQLVACGVSAARISMILERGASFVRPATRGRKTNAISVAAQNTSGDFFAQCFFIGRTRFVEREFSFPRSVSHHTATHGDHTL
jgi:hypothetical protein